MFALIDNYDSFTYNLYHYLGELGAEVVVYRNDAISVEALFALSPQGIILSPGPGVPSQAGICLDVVRKSAELAVPLMGVCLGHQAIGEVFGADVCRAPTAVHGKTSVITHNNTGLFHALPEKFQVTRYHSLIVNKSKLPNSMVIDSEFDGNIMGMHHAASPLYGVQFHPESIETLDLDERSNWQQASMDATTVGHRLLKNFLEIATEQNDFRKVA